MKEVTFIWFNDDIVPDNFESPIIYCSVNNRIGILKNTYSMFNGDNNTKHSNWSWLKEKYNIKYWTYQNNLIPLL